MNNKFGRKPKVTDTRDWKYEDFRLKAGKLPTIPTVFGHGKTYTDWLMLANGPDPTAPGKAAEGVGDCVVASASHQTMEALTDANYTPAEVAAVAKLFNGATAIADYSAAGGYNSETGANDNGLEIREFLKYRQNPGIIDTTGKRHTVGAYVSVEFHNPEHLAEAVYLFEGTPLGFKVQQAQLDQMSAGEASGNIVWDYVEGSPEVGGHDVPFVGRPGANYAVITWGKRIEFTQALIDHQVEEVWAYISTERVNKVTGKTREAVDEAALEEYISLVGKAA